MGIHSYQLEQSQKYSSTLLQQLHQFVYHISSLASLILQFTYSKCSNRSRIAYLNISGPQNTYSLNFYHFNTPYSQIPFSPTKSLLSQYNTPNINQVRVLLSKYYHLLTQNDPTSLYPPHSSDSNRAAHHRTHPHRTRGPLFKSILPRRTRIKAPT